MSKPSAALALLNVEVFDEEVAVTVQNNGPAAVTGFDLKLKYFVLPGDQLVFDGTETVQYASGAYVRERFDQPLAHWPMFDAVVRAKQRGRRWFDVGEIRHRSDVGDKEAAIGFFKRGFTNRFEARIKWDLPTDARSS